MAEATAGVMVVGFVGRRFFEATTAATVVLGAAVLYQLLGSLSRFTFKTKISFVFSQCRDSSVPL